MSLTTDVVDKNALSGYLMWTTKYWSGSEKPQVSTFLLVDPWLSKKHQKMVSGESGDVDENIVSNWKTSFPTLIESDDASGIFNID